jgi:hypothetical protein
MAGVAAEAGEAEKASEILNFRRAIAAWSITSLKNAAAGCSHAPDRLPGDEFSA